MVRFQYPSIKKSDHPNVHLKGIRLHKQSINAMAKLINERHFLHKQIVNAHNISACLPGILWAISMARIKIILLAEQEFLL
jgi:hypothetical protein